MTKSEIKDQVQRQGLNKWYKNNCCGLLEYATGSGKTRCGVLASQYLVDLISDAMILVITPRERIRDEVWKDEFEKWGASDIYRDNVRTECIQTVHKWYGEHYDLVIADEYHGTLSEEFIKFYENNDYDRILALTAYLPEDKREAESITGAELVDKVTPRKAKKLGLISDHVEYAVPVHLSKAEWEKYKALEDGFIKCRENLGGKKKAFGVAQKFRNKYAKRPLDSITDLHIRDKVATARKFWDLMGKRKQMLYDSRDKVNMVQKILSRHHEDIGSSIIFFQSKKAADRLQNMAPSIIGSYHSTSGEDPLDKWSRGEIPHLASCKKLNEGINIPRVNYAIIAGCNASRKDRIQRTGRVLRNDETDMSYVIDLYVPYTQDEQWLMSSLGEDKDKVIWLEDIDELSKQIRRHGH